MRFRTMAMLLATGMVGACGGGDVPQGAIGSDTTAAAADQMLSPAGGAVDLGEPIDTFAFRGVEPDTADQVTGTLRIYPDTAAPAGQSGATGGGFRIEAVLDGLSPGGHAWHIHEGECVAAGQIVVPFTDAAAGKGIAGPLSADASGMARALVTVPAQQLTVERLNEQPYSVRIHQGVGIDPGPPIACATLR